MIYDNISGQTFGLLTVEEYAGSKNARSFWRCRCACGKEHFATQKNLKRGSVRSCGCARVSAMIEKRTRHGNNRGGRRTKEYRAWAHIKGRTQNPSDRAYSIYGGRGIAMCERWSNSFEAFLTDMGPAPSPRHSIERVDNDGNYEPSNCKWATCAEQSRNTRRTIKINGVALKDVCEQAGLSYGAIQQRIRRGMTPEEAVSFKGRAMLSALSSSGEG